MHETVKTSFRFYRGRSMRTTFRPGDCIIFEEVRSDQLKRGDVIVFSSDSVPGLDVVHRIVDIGVDFFGVKGDDNPAGTAEKVPFQRVLGRVVAVEREGQRRKSVGGGKRGSLWAGFVSRKGIPRKVARWFYSVLNHSGVVRLFWRPEIETIHLSTDADSVVRLVSGGNTVGKWCEERKILVLRKPWDLVVRVRDGELQL
jgi:signal peptidase I